MPTGAPPLLRTNGSGRLIMGQRLALPRALTSPGDAVDFPQDSYAYGIVLEEHYLTDTTGTVESYGTPVVSALVLRERLHPKFRLEHQFTILAGNRIARRDGVREARSADQLLTHLTRAASAPETTVLQLPYEVTVGLFLDWLAADAADVEQALRHRDGDRGGHARLPDGSDIRHRGPTLRTSAWTASRNAPLTS